MKTLRRILFCAVVLLGGCTASSTDPNMELPQDSNVTVADTGPADIVRQDLAGRDLHHPGYDFTFLTNGIDGSDEGWVRGPNGLLWHEKSLNTMDWAGAQKYCTASQRGGVLSWRLPTISELRTLIIGCPGNEPGGICNVDESSCSSSSCWTKSSCAGCIRKSGDLFQSCYWYPSYFGLCSDVGWWSSTVVSDEPDRVWIVAFHVGQVVMGDMNEKYYVRCVSGGD